MAERTRVIIADDEALIRMDLREMLTHLGYLVVGEVADGRSAINQSRELRPDIVIMDIKMPDMDGIEAAKVLTEEKVAPVVLLSAYSQRELVDRAREAGVTAYLVKPYREEDLTPAIEVALARFREFQELEKQVTDLQQALETRKLVDRAKGILMDKQGLTEEKVAPVVLLSAYSQRELVDRAREAGVTAYLVKPYREEDLTPAIEVALARFREFQELEKQVTDLQQALETRKLVDRAKGILMDKQGLTEAEAFRKIQKMSMDNRKPMKDVAEAIILAHQVGAG